MKSIQKKRLIWLIVGGLVFVGLLMTLWVVFIGGLLYTPQIAGKIIDSETKRPIANARISTNWDSENIMDASVNLNPIPPIIADRDGNFCIPRVLKPLFPISQLESLDLLIYASGYDFTVLFLDDLSVKAVKHGIKPTVVSQANTRFMLNPLHTADENWNSIEALDDELSLNLWGKPNQPGFKPKIEFLGGEFEVIADKYPALAPKALNASGGVYFGGAYYVRDLKTKAIKQFEKVISRFPDSEEAKEAKKSIQEIKSWPAIDN